MNRSTRGNLAHLPAVEGSAEVERLTRVYSSYQEDRSVLKRWSPDNKGNQIAVSDRLALTRSLLDTNGFWPLVDARILDVACGAGSELARFLEWGALAQNLYGIDLQRDLVDKARARFSGIDFRQGNAEYLEFDDKSFDLVIAFTVFTSIVDEMMATRVAAEIRRVLRPAGAVVWYDFRYNGPRNPHVRGIGRDSIVKLFPGFDLRLFTTTLFHPLRGGLVGLPRFCTELWPPFRFAEVTTRVCC